MPEQRTERTGNQPGTMSGTSLCGSFRFRSVPAKIQQPSWGGKGNGPVSQTQGNQCVATTGCGSMFACDSEYVCVARLLTCRLYNPGQSLASGFILRSPLFAVLILLRFSPLSPPARRHSSIFSCSRLRFQRRERKNGSPHLLRDSNSVLP